MKKLMLITMILVGCVLTGNVFADSRVDAVWKCKLNDGKKMSEVNAANGAWLAHVNGAVDSGTVTSGTSTAIVGSTGHFYFVDSYESLAHWAAATEYVDSEAGTAAMAEITGQFEDIFECEDSNLYKYTPN